MPIQKQNIDISFAQGLETKVDPFRVPPGKFLSLKNSIFTKQGQLTKRNGFGLLSNLPTGTNAGTLTTFSGNLTAIGNSVQAYSASSNQWENRGFYKGVELSTKALVRTPYSNSAVDTAVSPSGAACIVFLDGDGSYKYQISDVTTGQVLVSITNLPATGTLPRVFVLGQRFIITFLATVAASPHLRYIAIPLLNLSNPAAAVDISTQVSGLTAGYDGVIANNNLYIAWDGNDGGGAIRVTRIDRTLAQSSTVALAGHASSLMSVTADITGTTPVIYITAYKTNNAYTAVLNQNLVTITALTHSIDTVTVVALTSSAQNAVATILYETQNSYASPGSARSDFVSSVTFSQSGTVGTPGVVLRSVGLSSKSFLDNGIIYFLVAYAGSFQPTYFLVDSNSHIIAKLAYSNGGGYVTTEVLSGVSLVNGSYFIGYLFKDLIQAVNKSQNPGAVAGVYTQTGVNVASFNLDAVNLTTAEIGNALLISGGYLWMYDGVKAVEQNFHLYPEDVISTTHTSGGSMIDQQYYYQVTYEWTDGQGNLHRSAPSIAVSANVSGGSGSGSVTLTIPTLRLTYKVTPNAVRIVIYRWSTAQQNYYQVTSVTSPTLNNPAVDVVTYVDTLADTSIIGNALIYTTGGVVENIGPPATSAIALYKSRLFLIDSEDKNLLWYSKQCIENTPVEMSDLFTQFIAPTTGSQGSTGDTEALAPMDDKLCLFKKDAIYYMTGNGPDNTGANNDFSEGVFITSTVGSNNQRSIVFVPSGLMFQSDKGIWLLGRDLSTNYIGEGVQAFNDSIVLSSNEIPGTNQVRFLLDNDLWLMFDYYYNQWGTFSGIPGISSTLYSGEHTYLNESGVIFQETQGVYLDNSNPTLMSFTSSWFQPAGVQGYQRSYYFNLLGTYYSPHTLAMYIAYDYNSAPTQFIKINPTNYTANWGGDLNWGSNSAWGGPGNVEQWKVNLQNQRCQAFQISIAEQFDSSFGMPSGAGLTLSGMNLVVGVKKGFVPMGASQTVG